METLALNGLTLLAERPADATRPPILFLHGILGGAWYFECYLRFFAERGYPSYALDLRGHHGSRPVADLGRVRMAEYVDDALEAAAWLGRDGTKPVVFGHSMGGLLAQKLAEADAVSAAVLLCAAPPRGIFPVRTVRLFVRQFRYLGALLRSRPFTVSAGDSAALFFNRIAPDERRALHARLVPESGRAARDLALGVPVDASRVRCPVLSVVSSHDHAVAPSIGHALGRLYGAPVREYFDHAHLIISEPGWEGPAAEIEHWLDRALGLGRYPTPGMIHLRHLAKQRGCLARLRFEDGHAVRARLIAIDFEEPAEVIYEVREVLQVGPEHLSPVHPGMVAAAPLGVLVESEVEEEDVGATGERRVPGSG